MDKNKLKQLIKIRDNAPKGATYIEKGFFYGCKNWNHSIIKISGMRNEDENDFNPNDERRSLSDIRLIIQQAERIEQLEADKAILKLEQQAKEFKECAKLVANGVREVLLIAKANKIQTKLNNLKTTKTKRDKQ